MKYTGELSHHLRASLSAGRRGEQKQTSWLDITKPTTQKCVHTVKERIRSKELFDRKTITDLIHVNFVSDMLKYSKISQKCTERIGSCLLVSDPDWYDVTFAEVVARFQPVIFAILVRIRATDLILEFFEAGVRDDNLPLTLDRLAGIMKNKNSREWFFKAQWGFLVRDLGLGEHIGYEDDETLPFIVQQDMAFWGQGYVFKAKRALDNGAVVAVKCVKKKADDADLPVEFSKETELVMGRSHHHLVTCLGTYTYKNFLCAVMDPYCETSLDGVLDDPSGYLQDRSEEEKRRIILRWFHHLSTAVHWLHDNSLVHQDINPRNILIKGTDIYITNDAFSRVFKSQPHLHSASEYAAPELMNPTKHTTTGPAADIFSLGCVYLDLINLMNNKSRSAFRNHRRLDCLPPEHRDAFRENIARTLSWFEDLKRGSTEYKIFKVVREMLHPNPWARVEIDEVRKGIKKIIERAHPGIIEKGDMDISDASR